jgi:bleomycin hydrolase
MISLLVLQLREYTKELRSLVADGVSDGEISSCIQKQMADVYRIVGICLGIPSETFTWDYYDKTKQFHSVGPLTPLDFYTKYVKPYYNVDDKVSAICLGMNNEPLEVNTETKFFSSFDSWEL